MNENPPDWQAGDAIPPVVAGSPDAATPGATAGRPCHNGGSRSKTQGTKLFRRKRWIVGTVIGGALVMLAMGVWQGRRPRPPEPPIPDLTDADPEVVEAITEARRGMEQDPFSGPAWGRLGMVLRAHEFSVPANFAFTQAERLDPRQPRWPYLQGLTLVQADPSAGIDCLERAVELCGESYLVPRLRLAEALLDAGRMDEAEKHINASAALEANNPRVHLDLGRLAVLRQDWRKALEHLTACVQDEHARRKALMLRSVAYRGLGERKFAEDDESQAVKLDGDLAWPDPFADEVSRLQRGLTARLQTAESLRRAGRLEEAIQILEDTGRKYPLSAQPWLSLADLWQGLGHFDRAELAAQQAAGADPELALAWQALGSLQALNRRLHEAADSFRRAISLKPDYTKAHFNLACCLAQLGDPAAAAEECRIALRCRPDYAPARAALQEIEAKIPKDKEKGSKVRGQGSGVRGQSPDPP
jgi:tetratricopeptide (TPR) repeat protein